jgi:DNA polymerase-4
MERLLGRWGEHLWLLANGIVERPVCGEYERKSYSEETTFERDTGDSALVETRAVRDSGRAFLQTRSDGASGRTITLKLRLEGFETHTRSTHCRSRQRYGNHPRNGGPAFPGIKREGKLVRLVGIRVSNLEDTSAEAERQLGLFERGESESTRNGSELRRRRCFIG